MNVAFHTYCGEAGDLQLLLIGRTECGVSESELYTRVGPFHLWNMRRAKKKILKRIELLTGSKAQEICQTH